MRKLGTLIAACAGFTFGLLFAKQSGKELRKSLHKAKSGKEAAGILGDAYAEAGKEVADEVETISHSKPVKDAIKKGKKQIKDFEKTAEKKGKEILNTVKKKFQK